MVYVSKPLWYIPLLCVQWKTPDDGQRNCPKHIEFCLGVLVLVYLLSLFCITNFDILPTVLRCTVSKISKFVMQNIEFYSKNKSHKLVHLVGFILRRLNLYLLYYIRNIISFFKGFVNAYYHFAIRIDCRNIHFTTNCPLKARSVKQFIDSRFSTMKFHTIVTCFVRATWKAHIMFVEFPILKSFLTRNF